MQRPLMVMYLNIFHARATKFFVFVFILPIKCRFKDDESMCRTNFKDQNADVGSNNDQRHTNCSSYTPKNSKMAKWKTLMRTPILEFEQFETI